MRLVARQLAIAVVAFISPSRALGQIVITQIYGGGGNSGAVYQNDYIQLFNRGADAVAVDGWSVQYASATGSSWDRTVLSGTVLPGQKLLIQEASGAGGTKPLPSPDIKGGINLSASAGKVALVSDSLPIVVQNPTGARIIDFLGYGNANASLGVAAASPGNTSALIRKSGGCQNNRDNSSDFSVGNPSPEGSGTPLAPCIAGPTISAAGVTNGASFQSGPIAPGEVVTLFGSNIGPQVLANLEVTADGTHVTKSLQGTQVLFDGIAAPIIYAQTQQVSVIAPFSISGSTQTRIQIQYYGQISNTVVVPVTPSSPGIFTALGRGTGAAAVLNQDLTLNSPLYPAKKGSIVSVYATGAGQTTPAGDDGAIIQADLPKLTLPVTLQVADQNAEILYKGPAPSAISGLIQVNFRIPSGIPAGKVGLRLTISERTSQPEVYLFIAGDSTEPVPGTGPVVEAKLLQLQTDPSTPALPEIPTDESPIPPQWFGLMSWNTQVGGTSTVTGAPRPPMVQAALKRAFAGTYGLLSAEEVPSSDSAEFLRTLLPGLPGTWSTNFIDTADTMDNGTWFQSPVVLRDSFTLFTTTQQDAAGELGVNASQAEHPPQVSQFAVGDFDFTLVTVHLTYADGDTSASAREMRHILDYLDWYFGQSDHDPDVMVCGDFNIPSSLSGMTGSAGITLDQIINSDPRFKIGERRLVVTVHQPTSRNSASNGGLPVSNYDHCIISANALKALITARRVSTNVLTDDPQDPEARLTSDHLPIIAFFLTHGPGIFLDHKITIRPPGSLFQ